MSPILLILIGVTAAVVMIIIYHRIIVKVCDRCRLPRPANSSSASVQGGAVAGTGEEFGEPPGNCMSASNSVELMIPAYKYKKKGADGNSICAVCLVEFEEGEEVRQLPECLHPFHPPCIDQWLRTHPSCPLCRADMARHGAPTSISLHQRYEAFAPQSSARATTNFAGAYLVLS